MARPDDTPSMALFCDFENVALGVRDAKYDKFDIRKVLERLLLKGSIVVKKAYCDWNRYREFKAEMHEASFELIEIPHVRQSGKNSADIRMVVDALDLCYTKSHVDTFVIISGDSDFSPLVSKLRENAKQVIGVGVKNSTSDLLIANCDEFIFYDDLVREKQRASARRQPSDDQPAPRRAPEEERARREDQERRRLAGVEIAVETFEALVAERGDSGKIWASVLKEAIKRRKPDFNETWYGFRSFGNLLEEAQALRLLAFGRDEKSGAYVFRHTAPAASAGGGAPSQPPAALQRTEPPTERPASRYFQQEPAAVLSEPVAASPEAAPENAARRERGRRGRRPDATPAEIAASSMTHTAPGTDEVFGHDAAPLVAPGVGSAVSASPEAQPDARQEASAQPPMETPDEMPTRDHARPQAADSEPVPEKPAPSRRGRGRRNPVADGPAPAAVAAGQPTLDRADASPAGTPAPQAAPEEAAATGSVRKPAARPRRPAKATPKPPER
jgi:uncharacterized protein (TIGR00288 family)